MDEQDIKKHIKKAKEYLDKGDYELSIEELDLVLREDPNHKLAQALMQKALEMMEQAEPEDMEFDEDFFEKQQLDQDLESPDIDDELKAEPFEEPFDELDTPLPDEADFKFDEHGDDMKPPSSTDMDLRDLFEGEGERDIFEKETPKDTEDGGEEFSFDDLEEEHKIDQRDEDLIEDDLFKEGSAFTKYDSGLDEEYEQEGKEEIFEDIEQSELDKLAEETEDIFEESSEQLDEESEEELLEQESSEDQSSLEDIERIRKYWIEGAECFRNKDYHGCIQKMQQLLKIDPNNEGALGYIDMAKEKLELQKSAKKPPPKQKEKLDAQAIPQEGTVDLRQELANEGFADDLQAEEGASEESAPEQEEFPFTDDEQAEIEDPYTAPWDTEEKESYEFEDLEQMPDEQQKVQASYDAIIDSGEEDSDLIGKLEMPIDETEIEPEAEEEEEFPTETPTTFGLPLKGVSKIALYVGIIAVVIIVIGVSVYFYISFSSTEGLRQGTETVQPTSTPLPKEQMIEEAKIIEENINKVKELFNAGQYEKCLELAGTYLQIYPGNETLKEYVDKSSAIIEKIKADQKERQRVQSIRNYYAKGKEYFQQGKYGSAISTLKKVLALDPNNQGAKKYIAEAEKKLEEIRIEREKLAKKNRYMSKARELTLAEKYNNAIDQLNKALELFPGDQEVLDQIQAVEKAREQAKKERIGELLSQGEKHYSQKEYEKCIQVMDAVLQIDPENISAKNFISIARFEIDIREHFQKGKQAFDEGRYEDCIKNMDYIISKKPEDEEAKRLKNLAIYALEE